MAHESVVPGYVYLSSGDLLDASINRSPTSYLYNPEEERDNYLYDTDKTMTLLRFETADGTPMGKGLLLHAIVAQPRNTLIRLA